MLLFSAPRTRSTYSPRLNTWLLFAAISTLHLCFTLFSNEFVLKDEVYYRSLGEQLTTERIRSFLALQDRYAWIGYALTPLLMVLKIGYTALCLAVGAILAGYDDLTFKRMFKAALVAEVVFVTVSAVRVGWGLWMLDVNTLEDFSHFAPLSVATFFSTNSLPQWALYPLQTLNAFEFLYCLALGAALSWQWKRSLKHFDDLSVLALGSYGTGLILWIAAVTFFLLQIS